MENKFNMKSNLNGDSSFVNNSIMVQNKKIVKHALRQQVKRRKKNTTIAAGNLRSLPRLSQMQSPMSTLMAISTDQSLPGFNDQQNHIVSEEAAATMKEILASLPGFSFKSNRRRSNKRLSTAAQLEAGLVDLESPASILSNISLRVLLNRHSFQGLPPLYQRKLAQLLPVVDRQEAANVGLNNEFFARACQEWRKRLAEGEFTPENQQKLKLEAEKDKNKLDPWKLKHFEPIWGEKRDAQKIKSAYNCFARDQRFQKNLFQSGMHFSVKSDENMIGDEHDAFSVSLNNKIEQNLLSVLDDVSCKTSAVSLEDERDLSEFNVTIDILEDDDDDDRDGDEDEIGDDEGDDEDDEEEDDDVDDDDSDDNYEEDEDDEFYDEEDDVEDNNTFENRVTLTYLDEEAQHCREIVVGHDTAEEIYNQKLNLQNSFRDNSDGQEDISIDLVDGNRVPKIDLKKKGINSSITANNVKEIFKSSMREMREFQHLNSSILRNKSQSECFLLGNQSKCSRPMDKSFSYQMKIHTYEKSLQRFKSDHKNENDHTTSKSSKNENQGGLQDTYEEISACSEEVMYPILEDIEINSADIKISEASALSEVVVCREANENLNTNIQEEAFQEANNYVCSEMLDCQWDLHSRINIGTANKEELPWTSISSDIDNSVLTNSPVSFKSKLHEGQIITGQKYSRVIAMNEDMENRVDSSNYIQLPFSQSDGLRISTPVPSCMMKNFHNTHNSSILSFPQIQSIRFVQTNFQTTLEHNSSESINNIPTTCSQLQSSLEEGNSSCSNEPRDENSVLKHLQNIPSKNAIHAQNSLTHNTVVFQQQSLHPLSSRQLITTLQQHHQSHVPLVMNVSSRNNRTGIHSNHRFSRTGNREQVNSRSRNMTKEPPGAVNLERSYQICQAVIASSPNRDQLKAHLKPPPSLLTKNEKTFDSKLNNRLGNIHKRKFSHPNQSIVTCSRKHATPSVKRLFKSKNNEIVKKINVQPMVDEDIEENECYKFVKKIEMEIAPRASSAPPLPPPMIAVNLFKGRPASAGERSHEVISLKSNNGSYHINGESEPNTPDMTIGSQPPSPCECNIQEAMVICRQCGAFCHHDCIDLQCICASCQYTKVL
ncbi:kinesin-related protein 4 isoform X2 [Phymastichus coffea]|uniref:kinesin-related protein 4 isoform X2 n=1 Tax=Phymastichus coffea TaxID=108790 RepID=UPI00273BB8AD|nr:kinesin-related protein 4 isoform X2 [Phymastichus coffea]